MKIIAHRGSSGTYPENTLAAFQAAANLRVDGVEFDVHMTKDGELVVIHDETIDRTTNGGGYIKDFTYKELRQYDAGSWFSPTFANEKIPALEEVLSIFKETNMTVNVELKSDIVPYEGMTERVLRMVHDFDMEEQVIISSFDHEALEQAKQLAPHVQTALLTMEVMVDVADYAHLLKAEAIHIALPAAYRKMTKVALSKGAIIRVFTVNDVVQATELLEIGVHAIFTDYPEKMVDLVNE
ncbi:glycerophosphodiester phosphodiesterase [Paenisporosarcina cavernae]|uniref:Glycerophosphodiester phosphodiesterase n=1 Tax=Paenisporosarcina cavernae TaxID=2320858 RepID=A0A385YPZ6_9BACL|nr:glycerophosphodiester phosphodiesterase [Paenisporosarcina cavernae]AYC28686.1 glycerophosphodiester phosphodiesterase [Paenisporosarcina cavernae]